MRLLETGFTKFCGSACLLSWLRCCVLLLLSGVNGVDVLAVVVLILMYLRLVVCFVIVVVVVSPVVSVHIVVIVFVDACAYLW